MLWKMNELRMVIGAIWTSRFNDVNVACVSGGRAARGLGRAFEGATKKETSIADARSGNIRRSDCETCIVMTGKVLGC